MKDPREALYFICLIPLYRRWGKVIDKLLEQGFSPRDAIEFLGRMCADERCEL